MVLALKKNRAFTLAEVLITLGIIGVVAVLTIPTLLQQSQDMEIAASAKSAYSILSQATLSLHQQGTLDTSTTPSLSSSYSSVLNVAASGIRQDLFGLPCYYYKNPTAASLSAASLNASAISLTNGMSMRFAISDSSCAAISAFYGEYSGTICGDIIVDTNSKKGPNMYGKDLLGFWLRKVGDLYVVSPQGSEGSGSGFPCVNPGASGGGSGQGCTNYYIIGKDLP